MLGTEMQGIVLREVVLPWEKRREEELRQMLENPSNDRQRGKVQSETMSKKVRTERQEQARRDKSTERVQLVAPKLQLEQGQMWGRGRLVKGHCWSCRGAVSSVFTAWFSSLPLRD